MVNNYQAVSILFQTTIFKNLKIYYTLQFDFFLCFSFYFIQARAYGILPGKNCLSPCQPERNMLIKIVVQVEIIPETFVKKIQESNNYKEDHFHRHKAAN